MVTRVERYAGHCPRCRGVTLAPVPEGMEEGSPFSLNILALAIYLRFMPRDQLSSADQLFLQLFALQISEGALDAMFRRATPGFDDEVTAFSPGCAVPGSSAPTRPPYGSTEHPLELGVPERSGGDPRDPQ